MGLYRYPRTEAAHVVSARVAEEFNTPPQAPLTLRGGRVLEEAEGEAYVPTQQPEASQAARISAADAAPPRGGHRGGIAGADAAPRGGGHGAGTAPEGPRPTVGLIGRISDRATFDALRRDG